jgi:hypothetical protein
VEGWGAGPDSRFPAALLKRRCVACTSPFLSFLCLAAQVVNFAHQRSRQEAFPWATMMLGRLHHSLELWQVGPLLAAATAVAPTLRAAHLLPLLLLPCCGLRSSSCCCCCFYCLAMQPQCDRRHTQTFAPEQR